MAVLFAQAEIDQKIEIWTSLSSLYLDTDVSLSFQPIASAIHGSPFSLNQSEDILRWEVRPALFSNLLSVAGEWAYWSEEEIVGHVQNARRKPPIFMWRLFRKPTANWFMPTEEWSQITTLFNSLSER